MVASGNELYREQTLWIADLRTFFKEALCWNNILNYKSNNQKCNSAMFCIYINTILKTFSYKNDILN